MAGWTERLSRVFEGVSDFFRLDTNYPKQDDTKIIHNYAVFERLVLRDCASDAREWGTGFALAMEGPAKVLCAESALIEVFAEKTGGLQAAWTITVRSNGAIDLLDGVEVPELSLGGADGRICDFEEGLLAQGFEKVERRRLNQLFEVWFQKRSVGEADVRTSLDRVGQLLCAGGRGVNIDNTARGWDLLESRMDAVTRSPTDLGDKPGPIVF